MKIYTIKLSKLAKRKHGIGSKYILIHKYCTKKSYYCNKFAIFINVGNNYTLLEP